MTKCFWVVLIHNLLLLVHLLKKGIGKRDLAEVLIRTRSSVALILTAGLSRLKRGAEAVLELELALAPTYLLHRHT